MRAVRIRVETRDPASATPKAYRFIRDCTLRDFLRVNDYAASERADLIARLRADQLTPGRRPHPTPEMFLRLTILPNERRLS